MKCGIWFVASIRERQSVRPLSSDFQKRTAFLIKVIKKEKKRKIETNCLCPGEFRKLFVWDLIITWMHCNN